jgi:hypothetical protein
MVLEDQWSFGEPDVVNWIGMVFVVRMIQSFKGGLVELDGENMGTLSRAGRLLAEFVIELSNQGRTVFWKRFHSVTRQCRNLDSEKAPHPPLARLYPGNDPATGPSQGSGNGWWTGGERGSGSVRAQGVPRRDGSLALPADSVSIRWTLHLPAN